MVLLASTVGTSALFIGAILAGAGSGVELHETAGAVLLVLLSACLVFSLRLRPEDSRPLLRVCVAFVALGVAATLGEGLASGAIPIRFGGAPLVPLLVMVAAAADGLRVAWRPR